MSEEIDYSVFYQPKRTVYVIKKDGSKEAFNVQKVITAVGKSAYRALTKFTDAEKRRICQDVIDKVDEMEADKIPIQVMHNIVESALEDVKPVVAKSYRDYRNYKQDFVRMMDDVYKEPVDHVCRRQGERKYGFCACFHKEEPYLQPVQQGAVPEILSDDGGDPGVQGRLYLYSRYVGAA